MVILDACNSPEAGYLGAVTRFGQLAATGLAGQDCYSSKYQL
jgi:hypothetical protein